MSPSRQLTRLLLLALGVVVVALVSDPETACRREPGWRWVYLVAPVLEAMLVATMIAVLARAGRGRRTPHDWLKLAVALLAAALVTQAGIRGFRRYATQAVPWEKSG